MTYGNEMQDVMPNIFNDRYTSAIYNPVENLMIFRREYKTSEQQAKNALNFVEVRSADDIDKGIDKVLYQMDILCNTHQVRNLCKVLLMMQVSYIGTLAIQIQLTLITYKASISKRKNCYLNVVSI